MSIEAAVVVAAAAAAAAGCRTVSHSMVVNTLRY